MTRFTCSERPGKTGFSPVLAIKLLLASAFATVLAAAAPCALLAQVPRPPAFLAEHYDVSATLDTINQSISAVAKIEFRAQEVSGGVRIELHPNLDVKEVKGENGKTLTFERDNQNALFGTVLLPTPVAAGTKVTLTFTYAGLLANEEMACPVEHEAGLLLRRLTKRMFALVTASQMASASAASFFCRLT